MALLVTLFMRRTKGNFSDFSTDSSCGLLSQVYEIVNSSEGLSYLEPITVSLRDYQYKGPILLQRILLHTQWLSRWQRIVFEIVNRLSVCTRRIMLSVVAVTKIVLSKFTTVTTTENKNYKFCFKSANLTNLVPFFLFQRSSFSHCQKK